MPTTYAQAHNDVKNLVQRVMADYHPRLFDADVRVGVLMARNEEGDPIKHAGYAAVATIKPVSLKDRLTKGYDAELLIDEVAYLEYSAEQQAALIDHELSHINTIDLSPKQLKAARGEDPGAVSWKVDDLNRPKLTSVPGDWSVGDAFDGVIARHGLNSVEYDGIRRAKLKADAARESGEPDAIINQTT